MLTLSTPPPGPPGQPYLLTHFHVLLEPHEGLSGDHVAGGADGLPPFMDGPLPRLLRATCGAGPGPQGPVGAPGRPGCRAQDPRSTLSPQSLWSRICPRVEICPGPHRLTEAPAPGAGWAVGAGTSLLTVLAGASAFFRTSSGPGPSCFFARCMRDLSSALARPGRTHTGEGSCETRVQLHVCVHPPQMPNWPGPYL